MLLEHEVLQNNDKSLFFIVIPSFQYEILIVSWKIAKK